MLAVLGAVGLLTTTVLAVNFVGSGARQLLRNLDIIEKYPYPALSRRRGRGSDGMAAENTATE